MSRPHLTPEQAELRRADLPVAPPGRRGRPPRPRRAARLQARSANSSGRPSSRSATSSTRSGPRPSRPPWTSGKRGVPGVQPELPALPRGRPLRRLSAQGPSLSLLGAVRPGAGLLPLPALPARATALAIAALGLDRRRPDARGRARPSAIAGVVDSFAEAAEEVLPQAGGPARLASPPCSGPPRRPAATSAAAWPRARPSAPAGDWAWHKDAEGKTCAYVSLDATGVAQQGPAGRDGRGADGDGGDGLQPGPRGPRPLGRARRRRGPPWQARYVAGAGGAGGPGRAAAAAGGPGGHGPGRALDRPLATAGPGWRTGCG